MIGRNAGGMPDPSADNFVQYLLIEVLRRIWMTGRSNQVTKRRPGKSTFSDHMVDEMHNDGKTTRPILRTFILVCCTCLTANFYAWIITLIFGLGFGPILAIVMSVLGGIVGLIIAATTSSA